MKNRLNFYIDMKTLDVLHADLERWESDEETYVNNSFTVDVIDLPLFILYESDANHYSTRVYYRTERYTHDGDSSPMAAEIALGKGELLQFRVDNSNPNMGKLVATLQVCCTKISGFMLEKGLDKQYPSFDPEKQGLLIEARDNDYSARLVSGNERPAIDCITASGDVQRMRS